MSSLTYSSQEIRFILQNSGKIKDNGKCIYCDGHGYINWNENGQDIQKGFSYDKNRENAKCESCHGIGYTWNFKY